MIAKGWLGQIRFPWQTEDETLERRFANLKAAARRGEKDIDHKS